MVDIVRELRMEETARIVTGHRQKAETAKSRYPQPGLIWRR